MKKRILSLMLVLVLAVSLLTVAAAGANRPWEDAYRKTIKSTVSKYGWNIMLADIDMDGVPELQFGSTPGTGLFSYVEKMYTFRDGAIRQIKLDGSAYLPILDGDGYTAYRNDATGMLKVEVTWFVRDSASVFINNTAECSLVNDVYSAKPTFSVVENNGVKQYGTGGQWVSAAQYNALYAARIQGWSLVGALPTASSASAVYNKRITDADIDKLFADYPVGQAYTVSGFRDVLSSDYYAFPVIWAASHDPQITNGTTATTFSPNSSCTRGQVVTFLWRANGCPEPKSTGNPFADVDLNAYYGKAVLWAVENSITNGMGAGQFAPDATVTRGQVVTFLWRTRNQPKVSGSNPFTDVPAGEYYADAVLWAVANAITNGTGANTFSPDAPCTRAQIVTFLYRDMGPRVTAQ